MWIVRSAAGLYLASFGAAGRWSSAAGDALRCADQYSAEILARAFDGKAEPQASA